MHSCFINTLSMSKALFKVTDINCIKETVTVTGVCIWERRWHGNCGVDGQEVGKLQLRLFNSHIISNVLQVAWLGRLTSLQFEQSGVDIMAQNLQLSEELC